MNKGISQSGSMRSCEKHSDVFHHIRYANSPRAAVPHKSIEPPKSFLSLENYREAEKSLEKKLADQGYGASHRSIRKFAKAFRSFLFFVFFIPYFIVIQLPLTLLSALCSALFRIVRLVTTPVINAFVRVAKKIVSAASQLQLPRWLKLPLRPNRQNGGESKEKREREVSFWKKWSLPELPKFTFKFSLPRFSLAERWKKFTFSIPQWKISLPKISLPRWKLPKFSLPKWSPSFSFRWNLPRNWKFTFKKMEWKIPQVKNPFSLSLVWSLREKIAHWTLGLDFDSFFERVKERFSRFKLSKRKKKEKSRNVANIFQSYGERIENWCDEWVSLFPPAVQSVLRPLGRGVSFCFGALFFALSSLLSMIWNQVKRGIEKIAKVQDNLRSLDAIHRKTREKVEKFVVKTADAATLPVIRTIETVHNKMIPVRLQVRRWTFLTGIAIELSLIFLQEAILEFQMWNEERWISKISN